MAAAAARTVAAPGGLQASSRPSLVDDRIVHRWQVGQVAPVGAAKAWARGILKAGGYRGGGDSGPPSEGAGGSATGESGR